MKQSIEKTTLRALVQNRSEQRAGLQKLRGVITTFALFCVMLLILPGLSYAATNLYAGGTDGAAPLAADGSQVLVYSITAAKDGAGGQPFATAFGITINGSIANGDVTSVVVNVNGAPYGSTTDFSSWPNVTVTGNVKPTSVEVYVTLAPSAGGQNIGVSINSDGTTTEGGLPRTSSNLAIAVSASPDELSVVGSTTVAASATPGQTNVEMLYLELSCSNVDDGICTVDSVTVDDLGSVGTGDIDNMEVHFDDNTTFGDGTLGSVDTFTWNGNALAVDTSAAGGNAVTSGTPTYLWIVYDLNSAADTKNIQASVTAMTLNGTTDTFNNTGPWSSSVITVTAGAANALTSCGDCHTYPPTDGVTRNALDGVVVGSHSKHYAISGVTCATCHVVPATETAADFDHRNGQIEFKASISGGSYNKANSFAQTNDITGAGLSNCSNVSCHYSNDTPTWGTGSTDCASCHNDGTGDLEPWPNIGAHNAHFAAFGVNLLDETDSALVVSWCTICHTGAGSGTAKHADGNKYDVSIDSTYNDMAGNPATYSGGADGTCSNVSCHGDIVTPLWSSGTLNADTACESCHKIEVARTEDNSAITGMHAITTTVSGRHHVNDSLSVTPCLDCHAGQPIKHFIDAAGTNVRTNLNLDDAALDRPVDADMLNDANNTIVIGGTTDQTTCAVACHIDSPTQTVTHTDGPWPRLNDKAKASATDGSECDTCHGGVNGADSWTFIKQSDTHAASDGKVEHYFDWDNDTGGDNAGEVPTSHSGCKTCHGWNKGDVNANYTATWGSDHGNGQITMNGEAGYDEAAWNCTSACHTGAANNNHNLENSNWTVQLGNFGAGGDCIGCHSNNSDKTDIPTEPVTDFGGTHSHISAVTADDCSVCHHSNQAMDGTGNSIISLRDADSGAEILYDQAATDRGDLVTFCLSCHDADGATVSWNTVDGTDATHPFSGSALVPDVSQYWQATTANNHTYDDATLNVTPRQTKARSAHGFPDTNVLKQDSQSTYTNAQPVACLDCHPAHGSSVGSPTVDAGYFVDTVPVGDTMMRSDYSEPNTCWGCHDSAGVPDYYGDSTEAGWANNWSGTQASAFSYKQRSYASIHEVNGDGKGILCSICHNPHGASAGPQYYTPLLRDTWMTSPWLEDRACRLNPGGLTGNNYEYPTTYNPDAGTDVAEEYHPGPRTEPTFSYNRPPEIGHGYGAVGGSGHDGYFIDDNTFGYTGTGWALVDDVTVDHITQSTGDFAGLCKRCHDGAAGLSNVDDVDFGLNLMGSVAQTNWGASIHQTVKGWDGLGGDSIDVVSTSTISVSGHDYNNSRMHHVYENAGREGGLWVDKRTGNYTPENGYEWGVTPRAGNQMDSAVYGADGAYHQFACSKCHTPHASSLPRQMISNCLDVGTSTSQRKAHGASSPLYTYPAWATTGWTTNGSTADTAPESQMSELAMHCHNKQSTNTNGGGGWNKISGW